MRGKNIIVILIAAVAITAIVASGVTWFLVKKLTGPRLDNDVKMTAVESEDYGDEASLPTSYPDTAQNTDTAAQQKDTKRTNNSNVSSSPTTAQSNPKSAILFTIKDQQGKLLSGITCAVKADEGDSRMIPEISKKSDAKGQCSFQNLNPAFPYLVRVYWTKDKSRVSDVSLSWIPAGITATRTVVKP